MRITDMITQDLLDILSTSPHYFCRTWLRARNDNSNFDLWFKGLRKYRKIKALPSHIHVINDTQTSTGPFLKYVGWNKPSKPHTDGVIKLQKRTGQDGTFFLLFYAASHQNNINSKTKKKKFAAIPSEFLRAFLPWILDSLSVKLGFWIPIHSWSPDSTSKNLGSLCVLGKLPTNLSPKPTFCLKWGVSVNVGLGEG